MLSGFFFHPWGYIHVLIQDFAKARFECSMAVQGNSSGGYINSDGGNFSSKQTVNCGILDACMISRGFTRDKNGRYDASSMRVNCSR